MRELLGILFFAGTFISLTIFLYSVVAIYAIGATAIWFTNTTNKMFNGDDRDDGPK